MTLGGGVNALALTSNRRCVSQRHCARIEAAVIARPRRCGEAGRDFFLEHQGQALIALRRAEPTEQERGADIIWQIGDDLDRVF